MHWCPATEFVTLDGVAQAPGGCGSFTHRGWQAPAADQESANAFEQAGSVDALLFGADGPTRSLPTSISDLLDNLN